MKFYITLFIILNISNCFDVSSFTNLSNLKDKKQCLPLLIFTGINGYKLYQFIQQDAKDSAFFQALDVIKCLYMDYKCLKENGTYDDGILEQIETLKKQMKFTDEKQDCINDLMNDATQCLVKAAEALQQDNLDGYVQYLLRILEDFKQMNQC